MIQTKSLYSLAKVLRSKNSGPFELTIDIIFDKEENYRIVKNSGIITNELICKLYNISVEEISGIIFYEPAMAIKITMKRPIDSGSIGDTDVYGAQQHAPLIEIQIPV